ncbi:MAG TPA: hypothetical protein VHX65_05510 [Pirellulales bacterium]|jgi:hypothetical protein|nr:hypothetical protein [Pirellulales bacterium]
MLRATNSFALTMVIGLLGVGRLAAQMVPYRGAGATTVQLPTFNFFAISTSVEVPDSGEGFLGGMNSAASGSSQAGIPGLGFRPFANSATANGGHGGSVSVRATIHDFDAMDKALLGKDFDATGGNAAASGNPQSAPNVLATDAAGASLAEIRREQVAEDAATAAEAQKIIDRAQAHEAAGKPGLAKIEYRSAARRASGALKQQALANLQRLSAGSQSPAANRRTVPQ